MMKKTLINNSNKLEKTITRYGLEIELILCCSRTYMDTATIDKIKQLSKKELDWNYLVNLAEDKGVLPLLYFNLRHIIPNEIPTQILNELREKYFRIAARGNLLTHSLVELIKIFEKHKIRVIPYKGPTLALSIYGNFLLRDYSDLEILFHKRDYKKAIKILISQGYCIDRQGHGWKDSLVKSINKNCSIYIEPHYKITRMDLRFPSQFEDWWKRHQNLELLNTKISSFSPEDLVLILCVQLLKDCEYRNAKHLQKLCDIAQLLYTYDLNWNQVWQECLKLKCEKKLLFSLCLTNQILGTAIPEEIWQKIQSDHFIKLVCEEVAQDLFNPLGENRTRLLTTIKRETRQQEYDYLFERAITPNEKDYQLLSLPNFLGWIYYFFRPLRLITKTLFEKLN